MTSPRPALRQRRPLARPPGRPGRPPSPRPGPAGWHGASSRTTCAGPAAGAGPGEATAAGVAGVSIFNCLIRILTHLDPLPGRGSSEGSPGPSPAPLPLAIRIQPGGGWRERDRDGQDRDRETERGEGDREGDRGTEGQRERRRDRDRERETGGRRRGERHGSEGLSWSLPRVQGAAVTPSPGHPPGLGVSFPGLPTPQGPAGHCL